MAPERGASSGQRSARMSRFDRQEACAVSSGYIPSEDEPGPDEIVAALREAVFENPRLREMPAEEVTRQLILDGHLQREPSPVLVAEMLDALKAEEESMDADELSKEGKPHLSEG
jgi:hypothetical protein